MVTVMRFTPKKITILVVGMVFTAGLTVSFGIPAFAGDPVDGLDITIEQIPGGRVSAKNYNSSLSTRSVGKVRQEVGDVLLRYGVGGADINKVTDALEGGGVYEAELKSFLVAIGINEEGMQAVFTKLDELGTGDKDEREVTITSSLGESVDFKVLRENFRENVKTTIGHVDHGKTARIALAHGKGLRMLNRFRSAMARFDHILGRLESRILKLEAQGVDVSSTIPLIEEAKNMQIENEARMEELKAKYESLLLGKNVGGVAKEAHTIAEELKTDIENLHAKLRGIAGSGSIHGRPDR